MEPRYAVADWHGWMARFRTKRRAYRFARWVSQLGHRVSVVQW